MKPVEIGVGFFGGGGGEELPVKDHTNASNRQRNGVFFFLYGLFSYCRLNQEVLLRWLMEAVMEVVVVCSSDRRPTVYGMRPGYYKQGLMDG